MRWLLRPVDGPGLESGSELIVGSAERPRVGDQRIAGSSGQASGGGSSPGSDVAGDDVGDDPGAVGPVSYTHLDVYKRQQQKQSGRVARFDDAGQTSAARPHVLRGIGRVLEICSVLAELVAGHVVTVVLK